MEFLLVAINAKYIHSNPAVYSLQAYADRVYPEVTTITEYTINNHFDDILAGIYDHHPRAIGFSTYVWNIEIIKRLLNELPKLLPETDIWLGGPEVSYDFEGLLADHPCITGIIIGEGETTFTRIVGAYVNDPDAPDFSDIPGIAVQGTAHKKENQKESEKKICVDMDSLPFIYENGIDEFENRIVYYESSRGCPFHCSYCLSSIDKTPRFRSLPFVFRELQFFLDQQVPQVKFIDRTFNCDHDRTKAIWRFIAEHDNNITNFHFEIAADLLDEEEIEILQSMRPGLIQLEIGVQSTNLDTLFAIHRKTSIDKIAKVMKKITEKHNIITHLDLIAGLPYEGYRSFRNSFNDVYAMQPTNLQLGFLKVLKGAPIAEDVAKFSILYNETAPYEVLQTRWLRFDEIQELKRISEMVEQYYNSSQFTKALPYLLKAFESPFDLFEALADYYKEKGYFVKTPARSKKYEILIGFTNEVTTLNCEEILEALTMDYYLRENPKSKPDFVKNVPAKELFNFMYRDPLTGNFTLNENEE